MNDTQKATAVITAITDYMDETKLKYDADHEKNTVFITVTGDDFPVTLMFSVNAENNRVETYSRLPFEIKKEKAVDVAMAIAAINARIAYGKFCLYFDKGVCSYENNEYLTGVEGFSSEYGKVLVATAYSIIEEYNDKLFAVNKGLMSVKDFLASLKK